MLCGVHNRSTRIPAYIRARNMFIVHILPRKLLVAALAMKSLPEMNSHDVTVDRIFEHRFTSSAPVPLTLTLDCAVRVALVVPFTNVSTDAGSGANGPHPAGVTGPRPVTFVDADHTTTLASASGKIVFIDPQPFSVDGTGSSATPTTCARLLLGPINHSWSLPLVIDEVCDVFGRA